MDAKIRPETKSLKTQSKVYAVVTGKGVVARFNTKEEAVAWAKQNGYNLRYSGTN